MRTIELRQALVLAISALWCGVGLAHIRIYPTESVLGVREKYTMRVPNEKQVATIRIEGEFPTNLKIYDFEFKPGWKVNIKKDAQGQIVGATWVGTIRPYEFVEFGMLGINPKQGDTLSSPLRARASDSVYTRFGIENQNASLNPIWMP